MLNEGLVAAIVDTCQDIHAMGTKVYVQVPADTITVSVGIVVGFRLQYKMLTDRNSELSIDYQIEWMASSPKQYIWSESRYVSLDPCTAFDYKGG